MNGIARAEPQWKANLAENPGLRVAALPPQWKNLNFISPSPVVAEL